LSNLRPAGKVHRRLERPDLNGVGRQVEQRSPCSRFRSTISGSIRFTRQEKTLDSFAEESTVFGIGILILLEAQNQADESLERFAWFLRLELEPVITQVFSARIIPEQGIWSERRSQCHEHFEVAHLSSPLVFARDASTQHKSWLHAPRQGLTEEMAMLGARRPAWRSERNLARSERSHSIEYLAKRRERQILNVFAGTSSLVNLTFRIHMPFVHAVRMVNGWNS
jgi:hypothetical protein